MTLKVYLMSNSLGSYYVSLGMKADYDAFSKCKHAVEGIANSVSRLVGTVRNASVIVATGLGTIATASGGVASQTLLAADTLGISAKALKELQIAAKIARVDVNGFIGAMGKLDTAMVQIGANGNMDDKIIMAFGKIKQELRNTHKEFEDISEEQFIKADPEQRVKDVFNLATKIEDQKKAALWVGEILGEQGKSFYQYLKHTGKSINDVLAEGAARVFETEESMEKAMKYNESMIKLSETTKSLLGVLGNEVGGGLTPLLSELDKYLLEHGDEITKRLTGFADNMKTIAEALAPIIGPTISTAVHMLLDLTGAISALIKGDWETVGQKLKLFFRDFRQGIEAILYGKEVSDKIKELDKQRITGEITQSEYFHQKGGVIEAANQEKIRKNADKNLMETKGLVNEAELAEFKAVQEYITDIYNDEEHMKIRPNGKPFHRNVRESEISPEMRIKIDKFGGIKKFDNITFDKKNKNVPAIQDGIIRPNGQVTQVAPDDWVFALRDVGNFSNALAAQNTPAIPMRSWDALLEDINRRAMDIIPAMTVHNNTNAPQHITIQINQTVTSPSNDWLPQTLREQASLGVQDGLQQARKESFNRLQMMSGTL